MDLYVTSTPSHADILKRAVNSIMRHVTADVWSKSCCRDRPEGVPIFFL